jgi:group I intron endonuclease
MLIYKATNLINGKIYIGQTTLSLEERIKYHKRDSQRLDTYFYRAIKKYGWEAFKWEVIHDNIKTIEELDELEKYYIALYDTFDNPKKGYNTQSGGHHFKLTAEECKKRSERAKGESNPMYGKPGTWLGKHFSEEHKANLSKSLSGKTRSSTIGENNPAAKKIINLSTGEIFGCIKDACEKYQISNTALVNNIKGKTKLCCGCTWSYYDSTQNYPIVSTSSSVQIRNPKK